MPTIRPCIAISKENACISMKFHEAHRLCGGAEKLLGPAHPTHTTHSIAQKSGKVYIYFSAPFDSHCIKEADTQLGVRKID